MPVVIDASVVVAAFAPDEGGLSAATFDSLASDGIVAPAHWPLEIANAFRIGVRRGRFGDAVFGSVAASLANYATEIDPSDPVRVWGEVYELAGRTGLTLYDAAYAELAARRGLPLATLDAALGRAAGGLGIPLIDPRRL